MTTYIIELNSIDHAKLQHLLVQSVKRQRDLIATLDFRDTRDAALLKQGRELRELADIKHLQDKVNAATVRVGGSR